MSKVFHFLFFLLSVFLFASLVTVIAKPIFAADQNSLKLTQTPDQVTITDKQITIKVETKDGSDYFLEPPDKYIFVAWTGVLSEENRCRVINKPLWRGTYETGKLEVTKSALTASWDINEKIDNFPCLKPGQTWYFRLLTGTGWGDVNISSNWILKQDHSFTFTQEGGQFATIKAKDENVYSGEQPIVIITNNAPNADYTFWWNGDNGPSAYYSRDKDKDNPSEIKIPPDYPTNKPQPVQLCMTYGNWTPLNFAISLIPGVPKISCDQQVSFYFKFNQPRPAPAGPIKCTILPSALPPIGSQVKLKIESVPAGTKVFAYAINTDTDNQWPTKDGKSDYTYSVAIPIVDKATVGSYVVAAWTDTDPSDPKKNICLPTLGSPAFAVSENPAPVPPATLCTGASCTTGGGKEAPGCTEPDPNDPKKTIFTPGIATAIGCIHTNPPELIKDFMTFIVGISGGLAFLMMLAGAFQILTSAGNPETLAAGRSRLTSAVIGLLIVIFSILLLQIIGVDILRIPGFGKQP